MIRYIVDLSARTDYPPELALATHVIDEATGDYFTISTESHPTLTYWTDWGGTYDTPTNEDAELFYGNFLQKVTSREVLVDTLNSFLIEGNNIYIHLDRKPWQYLQAQTEYDTVTGYASAVRDSNNPSDDTYLDSSGTPIRHPVRLLIPTVPNRLSDPISGTTLQTTFNFTLINNDGRFDDTDENNFLNTPARIKRSDIDNPTLADFDTIRYGLVDSVQVTATEFRVTAADITRTLTEPATRKFTTTLYPSVPTSTQDRDIPIGYGDLKNVPLFEVATGEYIALDSNYITAVSAVYDNDGASISYTFNTSTGIITATDGKTADVTGRTDNSIGNIITTEIEQKGNLPYRDGPWDKTETDLYIALSAHIDFYFKGGELKNLVTQALKNDNAFLFTKNDGRLTLRQWQQEYTEHIIPSWQLMEIPSKDNAEGKRYFMSAVTIQHDKDQSANVYAQEYFNDSQELTISEIYRKRKTVSFPTDLNVNAEIIDLASRLLDRFGTVSEIAKVKIGASVADIDILDTVILTLKVNDRTMSGFNGWIVRDVDPAQDVITLESFAEFVINDMVLGDVRPKETTIYDLALGKTGTDMALGKTGTDMALGYPYIGQQEVEIKFVLGDVSTDMVLGDVFRARIR